MAQPYSTIEELPDFDIEFPEGSFDPDPDELDDDIDIPELPERGEDDWSDHDNYPFHELDDEYDERQGLDHPINWLH